MKLNETKPFFDYLKKQGCVSAATINNWSGGLNGVSEALEADDQTVEFVMNNSSVIRNRLQNKNPDMSGATIDVYIQRAQNCLRNFLEWQQDRSAWERKQASKPKTEPTSKPKKATPKAEGSAAPEEALRPTRRVIPIPTTSGDVFSVTLPITFTMDDLARVLWGLAVYSEDFDPATVLKQYGSPKSQPRNTAPAGASTNPQLLT